MIAGRLSAEQAAWLAAVPAALVTLAAVVVLGPPLADLALSPRPPAYWPELRQQGLVRPEGVEQARYVLALAAPVVLVALAVWLLRRPARAATAAAAARATAVEWGALGALAGCFVAQWTYVFPSGGVVHYFSPRAVVVAAAIAAVVALAAGDARARATWARWTAESRTRSLVAWSLAAAAAAVAVLPAIQTDGGIGAGNNIILYHLQFPFDETAAVLNGRSPLGDVAAQYASLWPYALAGGMSLLGGSLLVWTLQLAALTAATLLALFAVLRRVTHSSLAALALFLPLLATSGWWLAGSDIDRFSLTNYYGTLPLRYAGPFLLAWLLARHLDGARPRRCWGLFLVAGLALMNNADFGLPALGATVAALVAARGGRATPPLRTLALEAAAGLAAALALVTALLLARTGAPPHFSLLVRYARIYASGFSMVPVRPVVGVSTVLLLTYVAAIGVAAARALDGSRERVLTALLMWSGVFGLGAGAYYVGQSGPEKLLQHVPAWALAVLLLAIVSVRRIARRPGGRPRPAELACLLGLGLLVCSLAQLPTPWLQVERLGRHGGTSLFDRPLGRQFIARQTRPGEPVLVLTALGHRTAAAAGVHDVEPYTGTISIQTQEQLRDSVRALREAGGRKLFLLPTYSWRSQLRALDRLGFHASTEEPAYGFQMWVSGG